MSKSSTTTSCTNCFSGVSRRSGCSLRAAGGADLKPLAGHANGVTPHVRELPSPIYFVAICSDDAKSVECDVSSIYLDRVDDLLKSLEQQRVNDISQMQEQVRLE